VRYSLFLLWTVLSSSLISQVWTDSLIKAQDLYQQDNYKEAYEMYTKSKVNSKLESHLNYELAQSAYRAGDYKSAQSAYKEVLEDETESSAKADLYYNMGNSCFMNKDYEGAISNYKMSIRNNPNNADAKKNLSMALRKKRQMKNNSPDQKQGGQSDSNQNQNQNEKENEKDRQAKKESEEFSFEDKSTKNAIMELLRKSEETKRRLSSKESGKNNKGKDW